MVQQDGSDSKGEQFIFWDSESSVWNDIAALDLGSSVLNQYTPDFFAWDNILRICDGNFSNITQGQTLSTTTSRGWVGYIENYPFPGTLPGGSTDALTAWESQTIALPAAPTRGVVGSLLVDESTSSSSTSLTEADIGVTTYGTPAVDTGYATELVGHYVVHGQSSATVSAAEITGVTDNGLTWANHGAWAGGSEAYAIYPPAGTGMNLDVSIDSDTDEDGYLPDVGAADGSEKGYTFGSTFIYDGSQESPIYKMPIGWCTGNSANNAGFNIIGSDTSVGKIDGTLMLSSGYNSRITGCRIYCQHADDPVSNWYLVWDVDFALGARTMISQDVWTNNNESVPFTLDVTHGDTDDVHLYITLPTFYGPLSEVTYFTINGHSPEEDIDIRYKTSTSAGGFMYVGNCYKSVDGIAQHFPDRIWRCSFNTFENTPNPDKFPENYWQVNPAAKGDPIVKLLGIGKQLLAFGINYLSIYEVGEGGDKVVGSFEGYGLSHPAHAALTPSGVVFANKAGVFMYNGKNVIPLLEKRGEA